MASDERYVFIVEWYDTPASLVRTYNLIYFPSDKTIEMVIYLIPIPMIPLSILFDKKFDLKNKKVFLKRCEYPSVTLKDIYIGAIIPVYGRQLKVVDYADIFTRKKFESQKGRTFAMIKPDAYSNIGKIIDMIEQDGFVIGNLKMTKFSMSDAHEFYGEHKGKPFFEGLTTHMCSDFIVGMELIADNAIQKWRTLIGPTNPHVARTEAPKCIRALFGTEGPRNAVHGSDSAGSAQREIEFFFSEKSKLKPTAYFTNCSLCLIKPHIIAGAKAGKIIDFILNEGFEISTMQMFFLDRPTTEEFFDVYRGVLPEFSGIVEHFTTGPCIAIEVRQEEPVTSFREICGPHDPEIAKVLRSNTIRAKFGIDRIRNAVHCTDLAEDGVLEVQYFFNVLQQK